MGKLRIVSAVCEVLGVQYKYTVGVLQQYPMNEKDVCLNALLLIEDYCDTWGDGVTDEVWGDGVLSAPTKKETEEGVQKVETVENCELGYTILD
jgi:hypothetical protein